MHSNIEVANFVFSPDGRYLIGVTEFESTEASILGIATDQIVATLREHTDRILGLQSVDLFIVTLGLEGQIKLWNPTTFEAIRILQVGRSGLPSFSPSRDRFVADAYDLDTIVVRNSETGAVVASLDPVEVSPTPTPLPSPTPSPTATPSYAAITRFELLNPATNVAVTSVTGDATINLAEFGLTSVRVRAVTSPGTVGSVVFGRNANLTFSTDNDAPYRLSGALGLGAHTIRATPYSGINGGGNAGTPLMAQLTFINDLNLATATPNPTATPVPLPLVIVHLPPGAANRPCPKAYVGDVPARAAKRSILHTSSSRD